MLLFIGVGSDSLAAVGVALMLFLLILAREFAWGWRDGRNRGAR
jgi:hypothetical protein